MRINQTGHQKLALAIDDYGVGASVDGNRSGGNCTDQIIYDEHIPLRGFVIPPVEYLDIVDEKGLLAIDIQGKARKKRQKEYAHNRHGVLVGVAQAGRCVVVTNGRPSYVSGVE